MPDLTALMEAGWNIQIECKGKGREYELTFEGSATKVPDEKSPSSYPPSSLTQLHTTANTLEELVLDLTQKIKQRETM